VRDAEKVTSIVTSIKILDSAFPAGRAVGFVWDGETTTMSLRGNDNWQRATDVR
jgi:hypothetical protein